MARTLEEAAAENAAWEKQKAAIDRKWAAQFTQDPAKVTAPAASFDDQVKSFLNTYELPLRGYANSLAKITPGSANEPLMRLRASHLTLMIDQIANSPHQHFEQKHHLSFIEALKEGSNPATPAYSSEYANRLREAVSTLDKLAAAYKEQHGRML